MIINKKLFICIACFLLGVSVMYLYKQVKTESTQNISPPQDLQNTKLTEQYDGQSTKLSEAEAIKIVSDLPEVKEFQETLKKVNKTASFSAENNGDNWNVQVYENVKDDDTRGHAATFNWYTIDIKTGIVKCSFSNYEGIKYIGNNDNYPCK